ncbi:unnamed protein product [Moneuplotes crassus]|uniref:Uncharacterized protein n=1 Tax=Euplotes crassus TaxID=5936 RepID=A0AAD1XE82_EUPCR|nr:unnamed protein product [Moneuplotes crassus]
METGFIPTDNNEPIRGRERSTWKAIAKFERRLFIDYDYIFIKDPAFLALRFPQSPHHFPSQLIKDLVRLGHKLYEKYTICLDYQEEIDLRYFKGFLKVCMPKTSSFVLNRGNLKELLIIPIHLSELSSSQNVAQLKFTQKMLCW